MSYAKSFRFLHWNILKLQKTATNKASHLSRISNVIETLKPNIATLCEVGNAEELDVINQKHKFHSNFVKSTDTRTGQNCAMLSTFVPTIKPHIFSKHISKHFMTQFMFGQLKIAVISCHLLSNPQHELNIAQRENQARELKYMTDKLIACDVEVLLAGDINDFDNDVKDASESRSISNVVNIIKGNNCLITVGSFVKPKYRYTYTYEGNNVMLDHVFVTPKLLKLIKNVKIYHIKEKTVDDSDHDPFIVDFCL